MIAMVQVATLSPMFLLGLPAGDSQDVVDRRHLLLIVESTNIDSHCRAALLIGLHRISVSISLLSLRASSRVSIGFPQPAGIVPNWSPRRIFAGHRAE